IVRALEINHLTGQPIAKLPDAGASTRHASFVVFVHPPRAILHARIAERTDSMLKQGLVAEVKGLLARGVDPSAKPMGSIGYRQVVSYLQGEISEGDLRDRIVFATRQYAKRQLTWFKK